MALIVPAVKESMLQLLRAAAETGTTWWDDTACRLVAFRGCRMSERGADAWGVTWQPLNEPAPISRVQTQMYGSESSLFTAAAGDAEPSIFHHLYVSRHPARSLAELTAASLPDGRDPTPFAGLLAGIDPQAVVPVALHPLGPLDRLSALLGSMQALLSVLEESEATRRVLERIADYHVAIANNYLKSGVGAAWLADDYAGVAGPFIRPALWRRTVLPGLARIVAVYRAAAAPVFFHTCGRAGDLIGDLLDIGVTAFNLENGVCDLADLRARFGSRITFASLPPILSG